jgi:hypothetical protein
MQTGALTRFQRWRLFLHIVPRPRRLSLGYIPSALRAFKSIWATTPIHYTEFRAELSSAERFFNQPELRLEGRIVFQPQTNGECRC